MKPIWSSGKPVRRLPRMQEVVGSNSSEGKICFSHFTVKVQFCLGEGKAIIKDYSGTVFKAEHEKKIRALHYNI